MGLSLNVGGVSFTIGGSAKPSVTNLPKLGLVPLEGDAKDVPIMTHYNPTSLSFDKKANLNKEDKTTGTDIPASIKYVGGDPINLTVDFFFDYFEEKKDVRPDVMQIVHLAEPQVAEVEVDLTGKQVNATKRPPVVCFVWKDTNPLGTGSYYACITSVGVEYTMFLDDGTPCRAKVKISCEQVNPLSPLEKLLKATSKLINTAGLTAAAIESFKGGRDALESAGAKIEDPSTWPVSISIKL